MISDIDAFAQRLRTSTLALQLDRGQITPAQISHYLCSIRYLVARTVEHLDRAAATARALQAPALAEHLLTKREEERGHEQWADTDLDRLCGTFGVPRPRKALASIVRMVEWIEQSVLPKPHCYLAYMLTMERMTVSVGGRWVQQLAEKCGIAADMMTVIARHVELDRDHADEGVVAIEQLCGPEPRIREQLRTTALRAMSLFEDFCCEVAEMPGASR